MRLILILSLFFISSYCVQAQVTIGIENGRVYHHQTMKLKGKKIIADDSITYYKDGVDFYENDEGYYKKRIIGGNSYEFMRRTGEGKIETYSVVRTVTSMNPNTGMMTTNSSKLNFYSIEGGEIKKMKYKFLIDDLGHIPECRAYLKKGKAAKSLGAVSLLTGLGIFIGTMAKDFSQSGPGTPEDSDGIPAGVFVGAAFCFGPMIASGPMNRNYHYAIEYFNQHY